LIGGQKVELLGGDSLKEEKIVRTTGEMLCPPKPGEKYWRDTSIISLIWVWERASHLERIGAQDEGK